MILATIGFATLCVLALYLSIVSMAWLFVGLGFGGKVEVGACVMAIIAGFVWGLVYQFAPFSISLKAVV